MKKTIALFLSLVLLLTAAGGLAETAEAVDLELVLVPKVMPTSCMEIMNSDTNRAALTVLLLIELNATENTPLREEDFSKFLLNDTYVASDGQFIAVSGYSDGRLIVFYFDPATGQCKYQITETTLPDASLAEVIKQTAASLAYGYKNDPEIMEQVIKALAEALTN